MSGITADFHETFSLPPVQLNGRLQPELLTVDIYLSVLHVKKVSSTRELGIIPPPHHGNADSVTHHALEVRLISGRKGNLNDQPIVAGREAPESSACARETTNFIFTHSLHRNRFRLAEFSTFRYDHIPGSSHLMRPICASAFGHSNQSVQRGWTVRQS